MPRRIRQRQDQFVLDQLAHCDPLVGEQPVRRFGIDRIGIDLGLAPGEDQQVLLVYFILHRFHASLAAQLQAAAHAHSQARPAARIAQPFELVSDFTGIGSKQVAQSEEAAQRQNPLLLRAGRREFKAVDYWQLRRRVRHKTADDIILEKPRQNKVMPQPRRLVLASTSRYRRELLERLGLAFETAAPQCDETALPEESTAATALRLAAAKARSVAESFPDTLVIGSDQVASCAGQRLDKPGSHENALRQLRSLSGKTAQFDTAVALLDSRDGKLQSRVVPCTVGFRVLDEKVIESYLRREQPYDCAASAKAEGLGIALIERIETEDPTSLIGLPLIALTAMLGRAGLPVL